MAFGRARAARSEPGDTGAQAAMRKQTEYRQTKGQWVPWILYALCVVLFSEFVRPWTAIRAWARRAWTRRLEITSSGERPSLGMQVQAILTEWGQSQGRPRAMRRAGLPGGRRPFEAGDTLSVARAGDLLPFTDAGRRLLLPARRPTMRLRYASQATECQIVVDASSGMFVPDGPRYPTKATLSDTVVSLLASVVWHHAGQVLLTSLQDPRTIVGPLSGSDSLPILRKSLREILDGGVNRAAQPVDSLRSILPGQMVVLISDLLSRSDDDWESFILRCSVLEARFGLAHLYNPDEAELVGLCWDAENKMLYDRNDWAPSELAWATIHRLDRLRDLVQRGEGRFLTVSSGSTLEQIAAQFLDAQFFQ